jgi:NadR type nicotinamide-nucleotide adenylyltransferase
MRVVVTGSECTGKTTLAEALAAHYDTLCVSEFAREFVAITGDAPERADVESIARGQIALEDEARDRGLRLTIQDTDLLSTIVYSHHYYNDCPEWIEAAFAQRTAELYLLADIDIPWVPDGQQRDRGGRREEMHELFERALVGHGLTFVVVRGSLRERLAAAVSRIDSDLEASPK